MSTYATKNYTAHGGYETVIGGEIVIKGKLTVEEGAEVTGLSANPLNAATADTLGGIKVGDGLTITDGVLSADIDTPAANQAASTAATVAALKDDFNTLLEALKTAGLMAADTPVTPDA